MFRSLFPVVIHTCSGLTSSPSEFPSYQVTVGTGTRKQEARLQPSCVSSGDFSLNPFILDMREQPPLPLCKQGGVGPDFTWQCHLFFKTSLPVLERGQPGSGEYYSWSLGKETEAQHGRGNFPKAIQPGGLEPDRLQFKTPVTQLTLTTLSTVPCLSFIL